MLINIKPYSTIVLKNFNKNGIICSVGTICYFLRYEGDRIIACWTNPELNNTFKIDMENIVKIIDVFDQSIIYKHDPCDAL